MNNTVPPFKEPFQEIGKKNNKRRRLRITGVIAGALFSVALVTYVAVTYIVPEYFVSQKSISAPQEIKGKVITLKQLKEEYFLDYHNMFSDIVRENLEFPKHITLMYTVSYLREEMEKALAGKMLQYCIFDNKDKKLIGSVEVRELNKLDPGQMGIWLNENYWGGGRALEALKLISRAYFALHPEEDSYIVHVRLWNKRSYSLLKKFGFKQAPGDKGYFYEGGKRARYVLRFHKKDLGV